MMTDPPLEQALGLTPSTGGLIAPMPGGFSNGPLSQVPEAGFPFGGYMAALAARAMRQGLEIDQPLRTLTVQFLAAARFGKDVEFRSRFLRRGRNVAYSALEAGQGERLALSALATWGRDAPTTAMAPLTVPPPPRESLDTSKQLGGPMAPRFTAHVDYVYDDGPNILGGRIGGEAVERVWMRTKDRPVLDAERLAFLLDAIYPPAWTVLPAPLPMTSVDLRYDFLTDPTPENCPDGWAFFEFRMLDLGLGWTVDDVVCVAADGTPLAVARQRRRVL